MGFCGFNVYYKNGFHLLNPFNVYTVFCFKIFQSGSSLLSKRCDCKRGRGKKKKKKRERTKTTYTKLNKKQ